MIGGACQLGGATDWHLPSGEGRATIDIGRDDSVGDT